MQLAEEESLHDVGQDEDISLLDNKLRRLIELINLLHLIFLDLAAIPFLPILQPNHIIPNAPNFQQPSSNHLQRTEQHQRQTSCQSCHLIVHHHPSHAISSIVLIINEIVDYYGNEDDVDPGRKGSLGH